MTVAVIVVSATFQSATVLFMTVNIASEIHFNALPSLTMLDCTLVSDAMPL